MKKPSKEMIEKIAKFNYVEENEWTEFYEMNKKDNDIEAQRRADKLVIISERIRTELDQLGQLPYSDRFYEITAKMRKFKLILRNNKIKEIILKIMDHKKIRSSQIIRQIPMNLRCRKTKAMTILQELKEDGIVDNCFVKVHNKQYKAWKRINFQKDGKVKIDGLIEAIE